MLLGPELAADAGGWGTWAWTEHLLGAPGYRIAGGTDEIQHNILAERVLGLPREPQQAAMTTEVYERELCRARRRVAAPAVGPTWRSELFARMPGGHSGLTYRVETSEGALVVKSVPPGQQAIGRHDMLRQARIIDALAPTAVPGARDRRHRRERAGLVRDAAGRGRVPRAGARRPRGGADAGRGPDAARRRDAAGPARRTPRQGAGRRAAAVARSTSSTAGRARWPRSRRSWCRTPSGCAQRLAGLGAGGGRPRRWSTATTGSAT